MAAEPLSGASIALLCICYGSGGDLAEVGQSLGPALSILGALTMCLVLIGTLVGLRTSGPAAPQPQCLEPRSQRNGRGFSRQLELVGVSRPRSNFKTNLNIDQGDFMGEPHNLQQRAA